MILEVHPFTDGNGRVARVMMNAELSAANLARIVIPSVYRREYLGGIRRVSQSDGREIAGIGKSDELRLALDGGHALGRSGGNGWPTGSYSCPS